MDGWMEGGRKGGREGWVDGWVNQWMDHTEGALHLIWSQGKRGCCMLKGKGRDGAESGWGWKVYAVVAPPPFSLPWPWL